MENTVEQLSIDQVKERCKELEQLILLDNPQYKLVLKDLHEKFRDVPELLYALNDEEIAKVVSGLEKFTGTEIAKVKVKEKISKKMAANLSADDV